MNDEISLSTDREWQRSEDPIDLSQWMREYGDGTVYAEWEIMFVEQYNLIRWGQLLLFPIWTFISFAFDVPGTTLYASLSLFIPFACLRKVPTQPDPHVGIVKLFGNRLPIPLQTGWHVVPFFCFLLKFARPKVNMDWVFEGIITRDTKMDTGDDEFLIHLIHAMISDSVATPESGGMVDYYVGATFEIDWSDPCSIIYLDDAGEFDEVMNIVHDQIGNYLRGSGRRLTWLEAMLSTDVLAAIIMSKLGGYGIAPFRQVERISEEDIDGFIQKAFQNGITLIHGVGTKISRLDVKKVVPDPQLVTAAQQQTIKRLENAGILENAKVMRRALKTVQRGESGRQKHDGSISEETALEAVLINDPDARIEKKIERKQFGLDPALIDAINSLLRRN